MIFRGLQKTTLVDYPGKVACTLFVDKCNFRCPFCQNATLVLEKEKNVITEQEILEFLRMRRKVLQGVCITGGEPTLHAELKEFLPKVKALGYEIKLDTNGSMPAFVKELIDGGIIDYVAMDIKAPLEKYEIAAGTKVNKEAIKETIALLLEDRIDYEFRTTVVPTIIELKDMHKIGELIKGAKAYYLQQFVNDVPLLDPKFEKIAPYSRETLQKMANIMKAYVKKVGIRGV
ncbi:MAG: anaerobic ribonucleoside-triphosphate reductase activating protein [Candidatus Diapherotrites archaeon]|nr:anaerobic ribonucleoside-triphosphate reductase activating protein [Candidatus Diapherotrites archaeon]